MNKTIGILLVGFSLLTAAIVISLGQISDTIKEVKIGNFAASSASGEIPMYVFAFILMAICMGIYLMLSKNSNP